MPDDRHVFKRAEPIRLDALVREWLQGSWNQTRAAISTGKIWLDGQPETDIARMVIEGQLEYRPNTPRADRTAVLTDADVLAFTSDYVVVRKPEGLMTVPYENERDTLESRVRRWVEKKRQQQGRPYLGWVHRLDKETSGLCVFATSIRGKQVLQQQFQSHAAQRVYHAIVEGRALSGTIETDLVADRGDGKRSSVNKVFPHRRKNPGPTQHAITHVQATVFGQRLCQVVCHLETGRTHQIRIHLSETGTRIVGDPVYGETALPREIVPPRMFLHAVELSFTDPATGQKVTFEDPVPQVFRDFWAKVEG
ncbi:MAG: RluA family pseudouridine synthase [Verrucomicrobiota bacterium JB022]|nr:RluA family pseudouridine synthase [Verrucomicrobiota bacterium JB022]